MGLPTRSGLPTAARLSSTRGDYGRYSGLPIERARSGGAERLELLQAAGCGRVTLNRVIAGEEADLVFAAGDVLIVEIDGGPFHLDRGADARKEAARGLPVGRCAAPPMTSTSARNLLALIDP